MIGRAFERERSFANTVIGNLWLLSTKIWTNFHFGSVKMWTNWISNCVRIYHSEPAVAVRSSIADARGSISFDYDDSVEKQDHETEKRSPVPARRRSHATEPINNTLHSKDLSNGDSSFSTLKTLDNMNDSSQTVTRKTSFATLPNTTTWQQQSVNHQKIDQSSEFIGNNCWIFTFT